MLHIVNKWKINKKRCQSILYFPNVYFTWYLCAYLSVSCQRIQHYSLERITNPFYLPNYSLSPRANRLQVLVALENGEGRVSYFHTVELVIYFAFAHVVMFGNVWHIHVFVESLSRRRRRCETRAPGRTMTMDTEQSFFSVTTSI